VIADAAPSSEFSKNCSISLMLTARTLPTYLHKGERRRVTGDGQPTCQK
jgi:hypothetical protein